MPDQTEMLIVVTPNAGIFLLWSVCEVFCVQDFFLLWKRLEMARKIAVCLGEWALNDHG